MQDAQVTKSLMIRPLTLGLKAIQNVAQYPLHYVTYAPAKFEVAMSNSLGSNALFK